jgi:hypothetical protein
MYVLVQELGKGRVSKVIYCKCRFLSILWQIWSIIWRVTNFKAILISLFHLKRGFPLWKEGCYGKEDADFEPGVVAHTRNPSYLGGWAQEDSSSRPLRQKFVRPSPSHFNQWLGTVAHACHPQLCREARIGGSWPRPAQGIMQDLSQKSPAWKGLGVTHCLASTRPWVQPPYYQKKKKKCKVWTIESPLAHLPKKRLVKTILNQTIIPFNNCLIFNTFKIWSQRKSAYSLFHLQRLTLNRKGQWGKSGLLLKATISHCNSYLSLQWAILFLFRTVEISGSRLDLTCSI